MKNISLLLLSLLSINSYAAYWTEIGQVNGYKLIIDKDSIVKLPNSTVKFSYKSIKVDATEDTSYTVVTEKMRCKDKAATLQSMVTYNASGYNLETIIPEHKQETSPIKGEYSTKLYNYICKI